MNELDTTNTRFAFQRFLDEVLEIQKAAVKEAVEEVRAEMIIEKEDAVAETIEYLEKMKDSIDIIISTLE